MDFALNDDQLAIRSAVEDICAGFGDEYWLKRDREGGFPEDFYSAMAKNGWLGIAMPTKYGGAGLGILEAGIMMETVSASGAGMTGASTIHMNVFGLHPVVVFGSDEQKKRWLPPIINGENKACFGVTEPNTGLNTLKLKTMAVKQGDKYVVNGQKVWISTAQVAHKILLLARTTPIEEVKHATHGLSLFYTTLDRSKIEVREIEKMGRKAVDSNQLFIDGLEIPVEDRIGEEGEGFKYILHGLNPERVLLAAEATGLGKVALRRAAKYANERIVFDRPIGKNQGIQHPLAERWVDRREDHYPRRARADRDVALATIENPVVTVATTARSNAADVAPRAGLGEAVGAPFQAGGHVAKDREEALFLFGGGVGGEIEWFLRKGVGLLPPPVIGPPPAEGNTEMLADLLFKDYLLPFELTSILLLVAVVGSVIMAKKRI